MCIRDSHKGVHYLAVVEYVEDESQLNEDAQLVILSVGEDEDLSLIHI